jgi:3-oxoacyl-[acyl-carrier-protein] synthase II
MSRRVVITGIGAVTPVGCGRDGLWDGIRHGVRAARTITRFDASAFPSRVAAEIDNFDPLDYMEARSARRLDRFSQLAVAASHQALADAGVGRERIGCDTAVFLGSALGGVAFAEAQHARYLAGGLRTVEPTLALAVFGGAGATNVAMELGARGTVVGNANSCASGLIALGEAFRLLRDGGADLAFAGGAEAPLAPLTFGAFARIKAMTTRNETPATACRPFDRTRDGFVMAEGAAVLVLESLEHARARGARAYAEILGYGITNDAFHAIVPRPTGEDAARAMVLALRDARLCPSEVGYLNAHATGTLLGDAAEARAIRLAFGAHADRLPVSGTKGLSGHALGASGAIGTAITALVLHHGWLPPTSNLEAPDPACDLAHVSPSGCDASIDVAVTNAFGFGGINASLVVRRWDD